MKAKLLLSAFGLATASLFANPVPPITVTAGSAFTVTFDGRAAVPCVGSPTTICTIPFEPLSSVIRFSDFAFTNASGNRTMVTFRADVSNTSTAPLLSSVITTVAFNTTPSILRSGNSVSGAFDTIAVYDSFPGYGNVEFCLADLGNCAGSGSLAGVSQGNTGTAYASLYFAGSGLDTLTIDSLFVRYRGLTGVPGIFNGFGNPVPEPAEYLVLTACLGLIGFRQFRRNKAAAQA